jgi:CBS domain-containing protein
LTVQTLLALKGATVYKIEPTASIARAAKILSDQDIGALVVTDVEGAIVGIISERDIVRVLSARGCAALDTPVAEVMTHRVKVCGRHDKVGDIMQRMTEDKLRHLPVVEDGRIVGVVSIRDVVKRQLAEVEQDLNALREYAGEKTRARQNVLQSSLSIEQARFPRVF